MNKKFLSCFLLLTLANSALADGVNKKKKKKHKPKTKITKVIPKEKPKLPSLLETTDGLTTYINLKPYLALITEAPLQTITTTETETETRVYYFNKDNNKGLFLIFGGIAAGVTAIALLHNNDEILPPIIKVTPEITRPKEIPESDTILLFGLGLMLVGYRLRKEK